MEPVKKVFNVVSCGRDEYPGDGLRLQVPGDRNSELDKHFLSTMGVEVHEGDEVEITAKVVSRVVTRREPL